eukprot:CAMPEP_0197421640 /NCGR_PEP_ID=MMETSP1170-20131217/9902_1 /TAXON_ID=54406 /ORGANISM="Sarcinochrysis sp, Strain CCMP770" /LENGTH=377 /DNA_ID=CAMNT_0042948905 /DNA_START=185 /DNA_END=1318 /DNA_ORIENTATION=-
MDCSPCAYEICVEIDTTKGGCGKTGSISHMCFPDGDGAMATSDVVTSFDSNFELVGANEYKTSPSVDCDMNPKLKKGVKYNEYPGTSHKKVCSVVPGGGTWEFVIRDGSSASGDDTEMDVTTSVGLASATDGTLTCKRENVCQGGMDKERKYTYKAPKCMGMKGDPHVHTRDGHQIDIYLPVGKWVELLAGPDVALFGHVFSKPEDPVIQWFDGLAVTDATNNNTIFNFTIPHDIPIGEVNDRGNGTIDYFLVLDEDGTKLVDANKTYTSKTGRVEVEAAKLSNHVRGGVHPIYNDKLTVSAPHFTFSVVNSRETNENFFSSPEEQLSLTHIDVDFALLDPKNVKGPLVDLMFDRSDSDLADAWEHEANAYELRVRF